VTATVAPARDGDLPELLALMRAYCEFYETEARDDALLALSRALIADPQREGVQLLARDAEQDAAPAIGFATIFWSWSTLRADRIGVMNDLFVVPEARGRRVGEALIEACVERCRQQGAVALKWQTALDNARAQALYDRVGARRSQWLDYDLPAA
jgi:GNAT superfamily N-acetyltransferase